MEQNKVSLKKIHDLVLGCKSLEGARPFSGTVISKELCSPLLSKYGTGDFKCLGPCTMAICAECAQRFQAIQQRSQGV